MGVFLPYREYLGLRSSKTPDMGKYPPFLSFFWSKVKTKESAKVETEKCSTDERQTSAEHFMFYGACRVMSSR